MEKHDSLYAGSLKPIRATTQNILLSSTVIQADNNKVIYLLLIVDNCDEAYLESNRF